MPLPVDERDLARVEAQENNKDKGALLRHFLKDVGGGTMRRTVSHWGQMICILVSALQGLLGPLKLPAFGSRPHCILWYSRRLRLVLAPGAHRGA